MIIYSIFNKISLFIYIFFLIFLCFNTQIISQSSVLSGGNSINNSYGSISSSIGLMAYKSSDQLFHISDGVEHAYIINEITGISSINVAIFPNPTSDLVFFKVENLNYKNLYFKLFDISGNLLKEGRVINIQSSVSISEFPNKIFVIKLFRGLIETQSFKILKLN